MQKFYWSRFCQHPDIMHTRFETKEAKKSAACSIDMSTCPVDYVLPVLAFVGTVATVLTAQKLSVKKDKHVTISQLWIYPIKSCRGIRVNRAEVTPRGFALDRIFMVVDSNGKFISQRSHPTLALVEVSLSEQQDGE